jgi:MFS family permease
VSPRAYQNYLLAVLMIGLAVNYVDRVALGLLLQPIKVDLHLSDTQLGLMTGIAFALFYSLMGMPLARWADRGNRVTIISLTAAVCSGMVALCGSAMSFVQLLLIRVGVAIGEAGCIPASQSLIADYFDRAERPRAIARFMLGAPLSYVVVYWLAGWLNELYGWRLTFMLLGLPGLALSALIWFTLRDPRARQGSPGAVERPVAAQGRDSSDAHASASVNPSAREVCRTLWANVTFRHLLLSYSVASFFGYGVWQWKPAFFIRSYHMDTVQVGTWFAVIYGISGLAGMFWGGELASRRAVHNERLQLMIIAVANCGFGVISAGIFLSPNPYLSLGLMALANLGLYTTFGPMFAAIQTVVPPRMRAVALATIYLFANLVGMGLGPLAVGALSDAFRASAGDESLRYALLALCPGYLWAGWHLWRASQTVKMDVEAVQVGSRDRVLVPSSPRRENVATSARY